MFQFGGLGALFGGAKPPKATRGDGTEPTGHVSGNGSPHTTVILL